MATKGFAYQPRSKRIAAGRKGGQKAQAKGKAHRFTHKQAVEAGRKGGKVKTGRTVR